MFTPMETFPIACSDEVSCMEQLFGAISFPNAERACGTVLRHLSWPVLRHAERTCCWRLPGALGCFKGAGGPHRTPALMAGFNAVPCASAPRGRPGLETSMEQFFPDMGFPGAERACGTVLRHLPWPVLRHLPWPVLRHLPWPVLRHAERNFFVRQQWLFDTPAPQPVAGRRHLPKRCFGSGCARPVATRTPALIAGGTVVPCTSAPGPGAETANEVSFGEAIAHAN